MRKQSQVITQKRDVDQKIQRLTDKITATKIKMSVNLNLHQLMEKKTCVQSRKI